MAIKMTGRANPVNVTSMDSFGEICPARYAAIKTPATIKLIGTIKREKKYLRAAKLSVSRALCKLMNISFVVVQMYTI